jgi:hypothetical protein
MQIKTHPKTLNFEDGPNNRAPKEVDMQYQVKQKQCKQISKYKAPQNNAKDIVLVRSRRSN